MAPRIPKLLVYLGNAREISAGHNKFEWEESDDYVVAVSKNGSDIFVFCCPLANAKQRLERLDRPGRELYKKFNRKEPSGKTLVSIARAKKRIGKVDHLVYRSSKFGPLGGFQSFIHVFEKKPWLWVNEEKKPEIFIITGGKIQITKNGIEG